MRAAKQIDCDEATRLISAGLDRELSPPARASLRLHYNICTACRRFENQMLTLRRALRGMQVGDGQDAPSAEPAAGLATQPQAPSAPAKPSHLPD